MNNTIMIKLQDFTSCEISEITKQYNLNNFILCTKNFEHFEFGICESLMQDTYLRAFCELCREEDFDYSKINVDLFDEIIRQGVLGVLPKSSRLELINSAGNLNSTNKPEIDFTLSHLLSLIVSKNLKVYTLNKGFIIYEEESFNKSDLDFLSRFAESCYKYKIVIYSNQYLRNFYFDLYAPYKINEEARILKTLAKVLKNQYKIDYNEFFEYDFVFEK